MPAGLKNRHRIYISSFLMDAVYAFVVGASAVYALDLGASSVQLGILGAIGPGMYVASCLVSGALSDRVSRKALSLWGCLGLGVNCLFLAWSSHIWQLYLFFGLFSAGLGFYWPPLQSLLADSSHRRSLMATLGNFCIFWSFGFALGHLFCGYLTEISSVRPFFWAAATSLIILAVNLTLSESEGRDKMGSADFVSRTGPVAGRLWGRFLACSLLANFCLAFIFSAMKMLFPKLALEENHLDRTTLGLLLGLPHAGQVLMFWTVKYWHGWQYNRKAFLLCQIPALPGVLLLGLTGSVLSYVPAMLLIGVTGGFVYTNSIYYSTSRPPDKATRTGFHEAMLGLGVLAGPLSGGYAASVWGLHSPYLVCAALVVLTLALELALLLRRVPEESLVRP